jgi:hypothetical protein
MKMSLEGRKGDSLYVVDVSVCITSAFPSASADTEVFVQGKLASEADDI